MTGQKGGDRLLIRHRLVPEAGLGWIFQPGGKHLGSNRPVATACLSVG